MHNGTLWVVSVPIGDPDDITLRALKTLSSVGLIVAEHSGFSSKQMCLYGIETPVLSLTLAVEAHVIKKMSEGTSVALVSDSGTPSICDPGARLVKKTVDAGIFVKPVPGASAVIAALSISGFNSSNYRFMGRIPRTEASRSAFFFKLSEVVETVVMFETRQGMRQTILALCAAVGESRELLIATNLTKSSEDIWRGSTGKARTIKRFTYGEYVLVLGV